MKAAGTPLVRLQAKLVSWFVRNATSRFCLKMTKIVVDNDENRPSSFDERSIHKFQRYSRAHGIRRLSELSAAYGDLRACYRGESKDHGRACILIIYY